MNWLCCCPCVHVDDPSEASNSRRGSSTSNIATTTGRHGRPKSRPKGPRAFTNNETVRGSSPPGGFPVRTRPSKRGRVTTPGRSGSMESQQSTHTDTTTDEEPTSQGMRSRDPHHTMGADTGAGGRPIPQQPNYQQSQQANTSTATASRPPVQSMAILPAAMRAATMPGHPYKATVTAGASYRETYTVERGIVTGADMTPGAYMQSTAVPKNRQPTVATSSDFPPMGPSPMSTVETIKPSHQAAITAPAGRGPPNMVKTSLETAVQHSPTKAPANPQSSPGRTATPGVSAAATGALPLRTNTAKPGVSAAATDALALRGNTAKPEVSAAPTGVLPPRPTIPNRSNDVPDDWQPASMELSEIADVFHGEITSFISTMGLEAFYKADDPYVRGLCEKGAALAKDPTATLKSREDIVDMTRLALYDTVIYCDDSNSMHLGGTRIVALIDLVKHTTSLATMLDPSGVKVRFMNFHKDKGLDDISTAADVDKVMKLNNFRGRRSDLGTQLEARVLGPLLYDRHREERFDRPLFITTITDGAPLKEDPNEFRNMILKCKMFLERGGYQTKAVVFQVTQVGNAPEADDFITGLHQDPDIRGMVYCTSEKLDDKIAELKDNRRNLDRWVLDLLSQGIRLQA